MWKLALCDDCAEHADYAEGLLSQLEHHEQVITTQCRSKTALEDYIAAQGTPDFLLMDVKFGSCNGIDLVARLGLDRGGTQIIYITGYMEYCTKAYETKHVSFLVKPIQLEQLRYAWEKAVAEHRLFQREFVLVKHESQQIALPQDAIYYMESQGRKLHFVTNAGIYEVYGTMKSWQAQLNERFVSCHKSFSVNMQHIAWLDQTTIHLKTGATIPVSQRRLSHTKARFEAYLGNALKERLRR